MFSLNTTGGGPWWPLHINWGFSGGSDGEKSTCNVGDLGSSPGLGRSPRGGHGNPLQYSCLENPHGQRSLAGYSSWGHKESDRTEWLSTAQQINWGFPGGNSGKESICQGRRHKRPGFDPWVGTIPWRSKCNLLQYSCLENPMDRGAWWATAHGVTKSWTWLKQLSLRACR